jgi:hypothetical protein
MHTVEELLEDMRRHLKVIVVPGGYKEFREFVRLKGLGAGGSPFETIHFGDTFMISESELKMDVIVHEWAHMRVWIERGRGGKDFGCDLTRAPENEEATCGIDVAMRMRLGMSREDAMKLLLDEYEYRTGLDWVDDVGYVGADEYFQAAIDRGEAAIKRWEAAR